MSANAWAFVATATLIWLSVLAHKGKLIRGSEDGITMWVILIATFMAGMIIGMHREEEAMAEYQNLYCDKKGDYMICEIAPSYSSEPEYSYDRWGRP